MFLVCQMFRTITALDPDKQIQAENLAWKTLHRSCSHKPSQSLASSFGDSDPDLSSWLGCGFLIVEFHFLTIHEKKHTGIHFYEISRYCPLRKWDLLFFCKDPEPKPGLCVLLIVSSDVMFPFNFQRPFANVSFMCGQAVAGHH
jgi:hypothetical protein